MLKRFWSLFLILLGLPLVVSALACGSSASEETSIAQPIPTRTISHEAAIIATVNAAPVRPASIIREVSVQTSNLSPEAAHGQELFASVCAGCHGIDGQGLPNLGKDLIHSDFVHSMDDAALSNFIIAGRPMWDPANTTGIEMPPRGGNPALTDEDIAAIVAYIRTFGS